MARLASILILAGTIAGPAWRTARAQDRPSYPTGDTVDHGNNGTRADSREALPPAGFWPTPKLEELLLRRFADDISHRFGFNDTQRDEVESAVLERWGDFLKDNRAAMQPLVNEYLELKFQLEPPPEEEIRNWADRALPLFRSMRDQVNEGVQDLAGIARPEQRAQVKAQGMMLAGAMSMAEARLERWRSGEFDPAEFIEPTPSQRRAGRDGSSQGASPNAESEAEESQRPDDFVTEELSLWESYVVQFVRRFELDTGQRNAALSVLAEVQGRARAYRSKHQRDIERLEALLGELEQGKPDPDPQGTERQIRRLYGPIDELFAELKSRLDKLPTAAQRARVAAESNEAEPAAEEKPKPANDDPDKSPPTPD